MGKKSIFGMRDGLSSGWVRKCDTKRMRSSTDTRTMASAEWDHATARLVAKTA